MPLIFEDPKEFYLLNELESYVIFFGQFCGQDPVTTVWKQCKQIGGEKWIQCPNKCALEKIVFAKNLIKTYAFIWAQCKEILVSLES